MLPLSLNALPVNVILPHLDGWLLAYLLTFVRAGAMIMLLPVLSDAGVPARVRLAFALAVSAALYPVVAPLYPQQALPPLALAETIAREATAGVFVGAMARLIMSALSTAGLLIANQSGLAIAQSFDPTQNEQGVVISTFLSLVGTLLVFESGLHHLAIGAIAGSYKLLPPGGIIPTGDLAELTIQLTSGAFALGVQLAAPFLVFGLLIYSALGVLSRLMPQMQVFFLAMPLSILMGFVFLMLFLGTMMTVFLDFFANRMALFAEFEVSDDRDDAQRTEEPTARRLEEARSKGDFVKSSELATFIVLSGGTLALLMFAGKAARDFTATFTSFLERPDQMVLDGAGAAEVFHRVLVGLAGILAPATALLLLAALAGQLLQNRPIFTVEKLMPDFSKLSPIKGFQRLFGLDGIFNLIKGISKIGLVGYAGFAAVWPERGRIGGALGLDPVAAMSLSLALIGKFLLAALCVLAVLSGLDYFYQRQRFLARHRMTRQELKDEFKQSEGDPQVRAKIRQLRQERARSRMMAAVPKATVVVVNPTHYAVALSYELGKMAAPVCVAKGVDDVALRIRQVAEEHGVPVVENPPLARALHAAVEIDDTIPPEHYKAVAQIVGYVMRLAEQRKFWRN